VVTDADLTAIGEYIGAAPEEVIRSYCVPSGNKRVLAQGGDGFCIFFDRNCSIHPVKPRMCRQWPFISSLLVDIANWRIMASVCPGMRTDLDDETLEQCIRKRLA
jgi:Fe-S-cluster containining protein